MFKKTALFLKDGFPNLNNMLTLITKSTCCTHQYTYHDSGPASQSNMIISKNISTSSMAAYHDIFHQHHLICWWRSALTSGGVAHIWIYHLIILHCSWSWSNWVDLEIMRQMFYHVSAKIKQTWNLLRLTWPLVKNTFSLLHFFSQKTKRTFQQCVKKVKKYYHFKTFMLPCKITRCQNLCVFCIIFLSKL